MIKNKTILVTGCYGFVAQHLVNKLLLNKNKVIEYIIKNTNKKTKIIIFIKTI